MTHACVASIYGAQIYRSKNKPQFRHSYTIVLVVLIIRTLVAILQKIVPLGPPIPSRKAREVWLIAISMVHPGMISFRILVGAPTLTAGELDASPNISWPSANLLPYDSPGK